MNVLLTIFVAFKHANRPYEKGLLTRNVDSSFIVRLLRVNRPINYALIRDTLASCTIYLREIATCARNRIIERNVQEIIILISSRILRRKNSSIFIHLKEDHNQF